MYKPEELYTDEFLEKVCDRIDVTDNEEREQFKCKICDAGFEYLLIKKSNPEKRTPSEQKKALDAYQKALKEVQNRYNEVRSDVPTREKYHKALERIAKESEDPSMDEMFHPYVRKDNGNIAEDLFDKFISHLIDVTEHAKADDVGNSKNRNRQKTDLIATWVAMIRKNWPNSATVQFGLGDHVPGQSYDSISSEVLDDLLCSIDDVPENAIVNAMRKVVSTHDDIAPAIFWIN